jgi:UDP-glucuronate 4-epimerase
MNILITGCVGFIGFHCSKEYLNKKNKIYGLDVINDYYDKKIKFKRLKKLKKYKNFIFAKIDLCNEKKLNKFLKNKKIDLVIHLAAQAGVRYSLDYTKKYMHSNVNAFFNLLEAMKVKKIKKLLYASSSSVYGNSKIFPLKEKMSTSKQISIYGATKKFNEVLAYYYFNMFGISSYGLRFFTAYGPFGRPDMSIFKFCKKMLNDNEIEVYNNGNHERDFTYVSDVVESIHKLSLKIKKNHYEIINIAGGNKVKLMYLISLLEKFLNKKAKIKFLKLQKGDVVKTLSDNKKLKNMIKFTPKIRIEVGIRKFCDWFLSEKKFLINLKEKY